MTPDKDSMIRRQLINLPRLIPLLTCVAISGSLLAGCPQLAWQQVQETINFAVVVTADRYQLSSNPGTIDTAVLRAVPTGGLAPYTYAWSVYDPHSQVTNFMLDALTGQAARFRAAGTDGPYEVRCKVRDSAGTEIEARTILRVGTSVGLDITTERLGVVAGGGEKGQVTLHLVPQSGTPPYSVRWLVTGPDGQTDNDRLDVNNPFAPIFTSGNTVGTYTLTATITDANGSRTFKSTIVMVGQSLGLDVITDRGNILPGGGDDGTATLLATPIGGKEPYSYDWEAIGPDGQTKNELMWDTNVRSPKFESSDETGTYLLRCAVTDADGAVLIGSTSIVVGQDVALDITADHVALPGAGSSETAKLSADTRGGREPVQLRWEAVGPDGQSATALLNSTTAETIRFTPNSTNGAFMIRCTATDKNGVTSTDSLVISVGGSLSIAINSQKTALPTGGAAATGKTKLTVDIRGGVPPYTYAWSVINASGVEENTRLDSTTANAPTFTTAAGVGAYAIVCRVTDAEDMTAVDTIHLNVGQPLNVDVIADKQALVGGGGVSGQAQLITTVTGGAAPYEYAWSIIGPNNTPTPARLSSLTIADPVFTSDLVTGTYRLILTTTDALGIVFVDSIALVVSSTGGGAAGQNLTVDVSLDRNPILPSGDTSDITGTIIGGVAPVDYLWTLTQPNGITNDALLSSTTDPTVTFTSPATQGTYRIRCIVTDAVGNVATDSIQCTVTDSFALNLTSDVMEVAPGGAVNLYANQEGAVANMTFAWNCVNESGAAAGAFTTGSTGVGAASQTAAGDSVNAWTAPGAGVGTYRIQVTMTDARGYVAVDSVQVMVRNSLALDLTASRTEVLPGGAVDLYLDQNGGTANITYTWTCRNESGAAAGAFTLGSTGVGAATQTVAGDTSNVWTAPGTGVGTYRIQVVMVDARGNTAVDSVQVFVRPAVSLDLTTTAVDILPGAAVTLYADQTGGTANMTYTWSCRNESGAAAGAFTTGSTGVGAASQTAATDVTNIWTAPGAGVGTYRIQVTMVDARGNTAVDSVQVVVRTPLTLDLTANAVYILPGGTVNLAADENGGTANMTYTWTCVDESDAAAGAFTNGSTGVGAATQAGQAGDVTNVWTAAGTAVGTYRIEVTVLDARGYTATDSVHVIVDTPLTLDLTASAVYILPGAAVNLYADENGGTANMTYTWTCVDESNAAAGAFTNGSTGVGAATQAGQAGDVTNIWTAPAAGAGSFGSYRIEVVVVDARGYTADDTVHVIVGNPLTLDLSADDVFVTPNTTVNLLADKTGGETPYDYVWTAVNSSGAPAGTFTTGSTGVGAATQAAQAADVTNAWSVAVEDTYTITCSVTDDAGQTSTDSIAVVVTIQQPFTLDLSSDRLLLVPGETINLTADQTGGTANFDYAWTALDEAGNDAGTLGAAAQNGVAGDSTNTWQAPSGDDVQGTYRIFCTVTDAIGRTATDSIFVEIDWVVIQNYFPAPPATDTDGVLVLSNLGSSSMNAYPGKTFDAALVDPTEPRNIIITISDSNNTITGGTAEIVGINSRGEAVTETVAIPGSAGGGSTTVCDVPFAALTEINLYDFAGVTVFPAPSPDQVSVGLGEKFGLTDTIQTAADVLYVNEGGTVYTAGYVVDPTPATQSITFVNAPNGARNYIVVFRTY